jgi:predicted transcriptional regulator
VMSRQLFDCTSDNDLSAAERIMREKKVRRLPVLNKEGRPVGLLSLSDIARHADEEYARGAANGCVTDAEVGRLAADVFQTASRFRFSMMPSRPGVGQILRVQSVFSPSGFDWACST